MSKPFNGHRNYNAWNVSLWLNNKEEYYVTMKQCIQKTRNRREAAQMMIDRFLPEQTGDGVPYTVTNVMLAMRGM